MTDQQIDQLVWLTTASIFVVATVRVYVRWRRRQRHATDRQQRVINTLLRERDVAGMDGALVGCFDLASIDYIRLNGLSAEDALTLIKWLSKQPRRAFARRRQPP